MGLRCRLNYERRDAYHEVSEATLIDLIKAAAAVLNAAELQAVGRAVPRLNTGRADSHVSVDWHVLTVYRLAVD
jgi:hypothetical protein